MLAPLYRPYSVGQGAAIVGTSVGFLDGGDSYFYVHVSSGYLRLYLLNEAGHISQVGEIPKCEVFTVLSLSDPGTPGGHCYRQIRRLLRQAQSRSA